MNVEPQPKDALARLEAHLTDEEAGAPGDRVIAVGWATVELDRAAQELAAALSIEPGRFEPAADSELLGARSRVAWSVLRGGVHVVLLEPSTEGRLAGTLARRGEGPAVVWVTNGGGQPDVTSSSERPGPFGSERHRLDGPIHGPHRLVVEPADRPVAGSPATIAR